MNPSLLPKLLLFAWLLPLASFTLIVFFGARMGKAGRGAGVLATVAIGLSCLLSLTALVGVWLPNHGVRAPGAAEHHAAVETEAATEVVRGQDDHAAHEATDSHDTGHSDDSHAGHAVHVPISYSGEWYTLGKFGHLRIGIGYYIDSLTVIMFCMVTFIATCIHVYANGYMHDELHPVTDYEVLVSKKAKHGHGHESHDVHHHA